MVLDLLFLIISSMFPYSSFSVIFPKCVSVSLMLSFVFTMVFLIILMMSFFVVRELKVWKFLKFSTSKLVSAIFYFFTKWQPFKNCEKCFLFYLKSSFRAWNIQIFVSALSPLFLPVDQCFRGWLKKSLKVYDIVKNLIRTL